MFFRFDFEPGASPLTFDHPEQVIVTFKLSEVDACLAAVRDAVASGCWAAGFISYEAAPGFDSSLVTKAPGRLPLLAFGLFSAPTMGRGRDLYQPFELGAWRLLTGRAAYGASFRAIQAAIAAGQTYQVNYTTRQQTEFRGDARALYAGLQAAQRGAYGGYAEWDAHALLSASPELLFRVDQGRILCRPMKGTIGRGRYLEEDQALCRELTNSAKDRAENVMIVDLIRNDLGKVAVTGSVRTEDLFSVERFPTVHQMTSTVTAQLAPGRSWYDVLVAMFPCGSVTGAPKASTMRIIRDLESGPRGIYCGSLGYIRPDGDAVFNVAIRTVTIDRQRGQAEFAVGGGITADSNEALEYAEMETKSRFLLSVEPSPKPFDLFETLRLEEGQYTLLAEHLARLRASSAFFQRPYFESQVVQGLEDTADAHRSGRFRVRLRVDSQGGVGVEALPFDAKPGYGHEVAWAPGPGSSSEVMRFHKTTDRACYERWHPAESPFFDHLLWDQENHATEFTRGNLVVECHGQLWTPPLDCGLLPGSLRRWLLDRRVIQTRVLSRTAVEQATQLWFINSLQGWVPVSLRSSLRRET